MLEQIAELPRKNEYAAENIHTHGLSNLFNTTTL
jgi:hypothetical protein